MITKGVARVFFNKFQRVFPLLLALLVAVPICAQSPQTNLAAVVRHAPSINGHVEGSLQQLFGESVTFNSGALLTGDFLVPGTPSLVMNGTPVFSGTIAGNGSASPMGYQIMLNSGCSLRYLRTRIDPVVLPTVATPAQPSGTRSVTVNSAGQSTGDPATLRDLLLNGNVGMVSVPPGTYGNFTVNSGSGLTLGVAGATQPVVYNLQGLTFNGQGRIDVVGPVLLTIANGLSANGIVGSTNHPSWLQIQIANGGFTLNSGCMVYGNLTVPAGTVSVNGSSLLVGTVQCDRLTVNSGGIIRAGTQANQQPTAVSQNVITTEDTAKAITLTGTDPENAALIYTILSQPAHGTLSGAAPNLTYLPATNYNGSDNFTFKVNDGQLDSATATVSITVTPVNDAPVAIAQSLSSPEDTPLNITLAGTDVDGDSMTFQVVTAPLHGSLSGTAPNLVYLPATNYNGADSFAFVANDGSANSATQTVSLTITPVDDAPVAISQSLATDEDMPLAITLDAVDVEGDGLLFTILAQPQHGQLSGTAPNLIYTPATNYYGSDSFTFIASDWFTDSAPATVSITVNSVNDAPVTVSQTVVTPEDTATNIILSATDVDGDGLSYQIVSSPAHGTLHGTPPQLVYSPAENFNGADSFTFVANDGQTNSVETTVTLNVLPVNDIPVAIAQQISTDEDTAIGLTLSGSDVDGDALTFQVVAQPLHGTLSGSAPNLIYTPETNYNGSDSLSFVANDGQSNSLPATIVITVRPVNDAPSAEAQSVTTDEDTPLNIVLAGNDVENDSLIFSAVDLPAHGTLTGTAPNLIYTPATNFNGTDSFTFVANDGHTNSASATVSITVNSVNDAPVAQSLAITVFDGQPTSETLTASDVDGDPLAFAIQRQGDKGVAVVNPNGSFTFTPQAGVSGTDSFTFIATDGRASATAVVTVTLSSSVNHAPVVQDMSVSTDEDVPLAIALTGSDSDNDPLRFEIVEGPAQGVFDRGVYTPVTNFSGTDSFVYVARDGRTNSAPATVTVAVNAVNDPPQLSVPETQTVIRGTTLAFDLKLPISFTDVDHDGGLMQLSISATNGTIQLNYTDGLTWVSNENNPTNPVVMGTADSINSTLNGWGFLSYVASPQFSGDILTLTIDDLGNTGAGGNKTDTKTIILKAANVPPLVSIATPAPQSTIPEGQPILIVVNAVDEDGLVGSVKLFADDELLAQWSGMPPYEFVWTNAPLGDYVLSATATDTNQAIGISSNVLVSIVEPGSGDFLVNAGFDQNIEISQPATLSGTVIVQTPVPGWVTNVSWAKTSGPGSVKFSSPESLISSARFSEPGAYTLILRAGYGDGTRSDTLRVQVLPAVTKNMKAARSSKGTDFWLTFLWQPASTDNGIFNNVMIAADAETEVNVVSQGSMFEGEWTHQTNRLQVGAGTIATVPALSPTGFGVDPIWNTISSNSVHITASAPVTVYGFTRESYSADGYLALPTAMLGTNYMVLSYPGWSSFGVVATENDTRITVLPAVNFTDRPAGQPWEMTLQQGQTYRVMEGAEGDFTGTIITSDKPIAVFGGAVGASIPVGYCCQDQIVEQMPPVNIWGQHFVTMPLLTRTKGDTFRFLASANGTRVSVNGTVVARLNRGQYHEQIIDRSAVILASQPILVAQYANGQEYDGTTGDPFMMLVPPVEQFGGDYLIDALSLAGSRHYWEQPDGVYPGVEYVSYMNLIRFGMGTVLLDGQPVAEDLFQPIGDTGYFGAQFAVSNGNHRVTGDAPFGLCVYGWADYESYAFAGGIYTDSLEADTKLQLIQPTPFAAVGGQKTVSALVTNGRGAPVRDLDVIFSVSGVNHAAGRVKTTRLGETIFSYTGTNTGVDVISATLPGLTESVTNTWLVPGDNQPPVVSADNTRSLQAGLEAILSGVATDDGMPSGEGLHVQWRLVEGPGEVFFNNASLAETHATCSEPGLYTFEFSASDSEFSSSFLVTIRMDMPPTVSFAPDGMPPIVRVGSTNGFSVTAADMDGTVDRVEFFANDMLLGVATPDANWWDRFYFNWIPQTNGVFQIRAVAYDNHGVSSASPEFAFEATYAPQITTEFPENDLAVPYGSTNVTFRAHALDPDGIVTNLAVYFISAYGNRQLIHQVANGEMDYTGPVEDGGTGCGYYSAHPVLFVATDDHGITTELPWQNIIFEPPNFIRNLLLPHAGETVMVGQHVDLLAEALISPPAQIKNFVFQKWVPGYWNYWWWIPEHWEMVGQAVSSAPFSTTWIPTIPGAYSIRAIASLDTDWCLYFESATNQIYVVPAYIGASIISPADGAEFTVKQTNVLALELYDPTGIFDHAEFFANSVSIGQTTNAIFNWAANATNNYVLSAKVYDRSGNFYASSNSVTVHVIPPPRPVVNITHPAGGSRIRANAESIIIASLDDPASITTNVQFFVDGTLAYQNSTYFAWTPTVLGTHTLRCVALTSDGDSVSSALVSVTVAEMYPPTVTISTPTNGQRFAFDALPTLGATATDSDGSISNLTLTLDFTVVGETNGGSLQVLTTNVTAGWHELLAQATDNDGLGAASPVVRFFIERGENLSLQIPDHLAAAAISATEIQLSWLSIATNELTQSVLIERWNVAGTLWEEIDQVPVTSTNYLDSGLNPETNYRYRAALVDTNGRRSAYSVEVNATTRTVVPNYAVIDLTASVAGVLTNLAPGGNILTNTASTHYDVRRTVPLGSRHAESVLGTNAAALSREVARFNERWPQIQLDLDPVLLSPQSILPRVGYLTGPGGSGVTVSNSTASLFDPADPARPVKAFLHEHQALFGFGAEAISNAAVRTDYISPVSGARTIVWQQQVGGIPVFNSRFVGHITATGELAAISCEFIPSPNQAVDSNIVAAVLAGQEFPVTSSQALLTAVTNVGDLFSLTDVSGQSAAQGVVRGQTIDASRGIKGPAHVELTWFPASRNELKLARQVIFTSQWRNEMYLTIVSALDNQILYRRNLTADSSAASYRVFTGNSPAFMSPGLSAPGSAQAPLANRSTVTFAALDAIASPEGWIPDGVNETVGNNVDAHLDRNDDNLPDLPRPTGNPTRTFDLPLDLSNGPASYGDAAAVQLFYWNNWMHDALYVLGFTEAAGNFQNNNFGRGGLGSDAVQADAQDGLDRNDNQHHDNANMSTPPDGYAPRMQMYAFTGATPNRDGSLDGEIILHEYTHGLSSRLIGGGAGIDALQTAGMGEGWSDFYALALLTDPASDVDGAYPIGAYVTQHGFGTQFEENYYYGIRSYPYCTDTNRNPLTFTDIDPARASAHAGVPRSPLAGAFNPSLAGEVHHQGEVWCMMLWEVRANLIRKHGGETGHNLTLQLVTEGLRLCPPNPNFVQARDAILLADRVLTQGANATEIWAAFTKRGLGYEAKAPNSYTTVGTQSSYTPAPALVIESVEVQGGNGNGIIETNEDNGLLIVVHNQGSSTATQVSAQISSSTPGVQILSAQSAYADIPQGQSRGNTVLLQIRTLPEFVDGTRIDVNVTLNSDQHTVTTTIPFYPGNSGPKLPPGGDNNLNNPTSDTASMKDLTPWDLGNLEPLWMAEDASCLLKAGTGKYVLWRPGADPLTIENPQFIAHRLTRHGVVVGAVNEPDTTDEAGNQVKHSWGAWWDFNANKPVPLTRTDGYTWPRNAGPLLNCGNVYSATLTNEFGYPLFITNVTSFPTLHDVWDMNSAGVSVGSLSMQETFAPQQILFDSLGAMTWFTPSERGLDAGRGSSPATQVNYWAQLTTAAQFNSAENWRWLGPLNWVTPTAYATLINDSGTIAGVSAVNTGDPIMDALRPTHAFRVSASGEATPFNTLTTDLGTLTNGLHSFPRAMNQAGEMVGYSDFDVSITGGLNANSWNAHAVYWGATDSAPTHLGTLGPVSEAPWGYSDAYAINDNRQVVGTSLLLDPNSGNATQAGVLWQWNEGKKATPGWEIGDLNQWVDDDWSVAKGMGINDAGFILAKAKKSDQAGDQAVLLPPVEVNSIDRYVEVRIPDYVVKAMGGRENFALRISGGGWAQPYTLALSTAKVYTRAQDTPAEEGVFFPASETRETVTDLIGKGAFSSPVAVALENGFYTFVTVMNTSDRITVSLLNGESVQYSTEYTLTPNADMSELIQKLDEVFADCFARAFQGPITFAPPGSTSTRSFSFAGEQPIQNPALVAKCCSSVFDRIRSAVKKGVVLYAEGVKIALVGAQGFVQGFWAGAKSDAQSVADLAKMLAHPVDTGKSLYEGFRGLISMSMADLKKIPKAMLNEYLTKAQQDIGWAEPTGLDLIAYSVGYSAGYLSEQITVSVLTSVFGGVALKAVATVGGKVAKMMSAFKAGETVLGAVTKGQEAVAAVQKAKNLAVKTVSQFVKEKTGYDKVEGIVKKVLLAGCAP